MIKASNLLLIALMFLSLSNSLMLKSKTEEKQCKQLSGFKSSCSDWKFTKFNPAPPISVTSSFSITCKDNKGKLITRNYDLNKCLSNENGKLVYSNGKNGGFSKKCGRCRFEGSNLICVCRDSKGKQVENASIDLNLYMGSINGVAQCAEC